jgi:hypothetical protein
MQITRKVYLKKSQGVMRVSEAERGGFSMMSRSGGLKERAVAGRPNQIQQFHCHTVGIFSVTGIQCFK